MGLRSAPAGPSLLDMPVLTEQLSLSCCALDTVGGHLCELTLAKMPRAQWHLSLLFVPKACSTGSILPRTVLELFWEI